MRVRRPRRRGRPRVAVAARGQVLGRDATEGRRRLRSAGPRPADATSLRLQAADAADDDNVDFWVGDGADCAKRKLKKAFCEPENVAFNPPLDLAKFLVAAKLLPALEINRSPENGGDKAYGAADLAAMTADFASGALHPGDLKPAVVAGLQGTLLKAAADGVGNAPDAKKDAAALKALAKKLAKMKK